MSLGYHWIKDFSALGRAIKADPKCGFVCNQFQNTRAIDQGRHGLKARKQIQILFSLTVSIEL